MICQRALPVSASLARVAGDHDTSGGSVDPVSVRLRHCPCWTLNAVTISSKGHARDAATQALFRARGIKTPGCGVYDTQQAVWTSPWLVRALTRRKSRLKRQDETRRAGSGSAG